MLAHKPVNRYLASKDAESAGAAAPDGASPRRLRTPPHAKGHRLAPFLQGRAGGLWLPLHRSAAWMFSQN